MNPGFCGTKETTDLGEKDYLAKVSFIQYMSIKINGMAESFISALCREKKILFTYY